MPDWSVMTWNVHGSARPRIDALAEAIAAEAPDVVALQEIRSHQARALARALGMRRTWSLKHRPATRLLWWLAEGLAILTPHDLADEGHRELTIGVKANTYRRRIVVWCDVIRDDDRLRVYDAHLDSDPDPHERRAQAARLAHLSVEQTAGRPFVIAGDLNDHDDVEVIAALPLIEHLDGIPPTNPADAPDQHLDHVLLPPDAAAVSVTVPAGGDEWAAMSDHLPVTARFTLP